ncbi:hypothetical protein [Streptomyces sp. NPDC002889]|uniref:hypothetical protein n=1 Tax=Streptomyces sp. NPDC002889 TaxID=3364669 RepID=UPI003693E9E4
MRTVSTSSNPPACETTADAPAGTRTRGDRAERRLRDTDRRIRDLDSRLDDLDTEHQSLKGKFGYTEDLDHELRRIRNDVSECESKIDNLEGGLSDRIGDTEQATKRLTQHVRLPEGQIMAPGGARAADLDTFGKDNERRSPEPSRRCSR